MSPNFASHPARGRKRVFETEIRAWQCSSGGEQNCIVFSMQIPGIDFHLAEIDKTGFLIAFSDW
jgi:hypothetical protein